MMYADFRATPLAGKLALVTRGSWGVGRGIARGHGEAGATVYATGRMAARGDAAEPGTIDRVAGEVDELGGRRIAVRCDHGRDDEVEPVFAPIARQAGQLDVLVKNVHSGFYDVAAGSGRRSIGGRATWRWNSGRRVWRSSPCGLLAGRSNRWISIVPPVNVPFWMARVVVRRFTEQLKERGGYGVTPGR